METWADFLSWKDPGSRAAYLDRHWEPSGKGGKVVEEEVEELPALEEDERSHHRHAYLASV